MTEPDWRTLLIQAARRDHEARARLAANGALFEGYNQEIEAIHLENAKLLERAFDQLSWPGRRLLGDDGAAAAFVILQHAISRPHLQRRGLELMLQAIPNGDANALDAAYLSDRIAVFEGREQTFGTQFDWDSAGQLSPAPIHEAEHVDERRTSVGLPPIAEAVAEMRARAAADGERPPADLERRREEFESWARRVGWRA